MQTPKGIFHGKPSSFSRHGGGVLSSSERAVAENRLLRELRRHCRGALRPCSGGRRPCLVEMTGAEPADRAAVARQVASALGRPLWLLDKYIGETEKNLDRALHNATRRGAVLLFDEADALFGRRTRVKDSHDRYANQEVAHLLQRLEAYRGIVILSTNLRNNTGTDGRRRAIFIDLSHRPRLS